jgi:ribose 1,5-bisphosphokinase
MTEADATPPQIGPGRIVLVVGPSGAGKDTLIAMAKRHCADDARVTFPRRIVTRPSSQFEDNVAMTPLEFDAALGQGAFALHWCAHDHAYGISRHIDDDIRGGKTVVVNVSRTIINEVRRRYRNVTIVLITAPSDVLAQRVAARQRASDTSVAERVQRAALQDIAAPHVIISNVGSADAHGKELADVIAGERFGTKQGQ